MRSLREECYNLDITVWTPIPCFRSELVGVAGYFSPPIDTYVYPLFQSTTMPLSLALSRQLLHSLVLSDYCVQVDTINRRSVRKRDKASNAFGRDSDRTFFDVRT
jgi:hypothetical protein